MARALAILAMCISTLKFSTADIGIDAALEFEDYEVIHPEMKSLYSNDLDQKSQDRDSEDLMSLSFSAFGRRLQVILKRNRKIFSEGYREVYQRDSDFVFQKPSLMELNCHYHGKVKDTEFGWASINTCSWLNGLIVVEDEVIYLQHRGNSTNFQTIAFRHSKMTPKNISCGSISTKLEDTVTRIMRSRSAEEHFYRHSKVKRFLELFVVADREMFQRYGQNRNIFRRIREVVNIVNGIFSHLDIFIVLVGALVWSERNAISVSSSSEETLNNFATYRFQELENFPNDNAQLLSGIDFTGDVVGLAFRGALCSPRYSAGINQDYSSSPGLVAAVMAHEIGHNFNMKHDANHCFCPAGRCIMAPSTTSKTALKWSSCSKEALEIFSKEGMDYCLKNMPKHLALPGCGNGIVELKEKCDCGLSEFCNNSCCNSSTCELASFATCATGSCCDLETCKLKYASTLCRDSKSECDLPEFCNGKSSSCPLDVFLQDGAQCPISQGVCYDGKCRSRTLQCHRLWGANSKPSDRCCFEQSASNPHGITCNNSQHRKNYQRCNKTISHCERLQCSPTNNEPLKSNYVENSRLMIYHGRCMSERESQLCYSVSFDFGVTTADLGIAETGTECGKNKVCFHQRCVPLENLKSTDCLKNCSGNGVCNNKLQCHCIQGFGAAACDAPGRGGSMSSGPLIESTKETHFVHVMYMLFFGIVPSIVISSSLLCWYLLMEKRLKQ